MKKSKGFSLTELMIALAVLGLLMAVALPAYRDSTRGANRSDAQITLSRLATLQERHFFQNNQYTGDFADLMDGVASGQPVSSDEGHYSIALTLTGGGTGWSMTATPQGDQASDSACASISLNHLGQKSALDSDGNASSECW